MRRNPRQHPPLPPILQLPETAQQPVQLHSPQRPEEVCPIVRSHTPAPGEVCPIVPTHTPPPGRSVQLSAPTPLHTFPCRVPKGPAPRSAPKRSGTGRNSTARNHLLHDQRHPHPVRRVPGQGLLDRQRRGRGRLQNSCRAATLELRHVVEPAREDDLLTLRCLVQGPTSSEVWKARIPILKGQRAKPPKWSPALN